MDWFEIFTKPSHDETVSDEAVTGLSRMFVREANICVNSSKCVLLELKIEARFQGCVFTSFQLAEKSAKDESPLAI